MKTMVLANLKTGTHNVTAAMTHAEMSLRNNKIVELGITDLRWMTPLEALDLRSHRCVECGREHAVSDSPSR